MILSKEIKSAKDTYYIEIDTDKEIINLFSKDKKLLEVAECKVDENYIQTIKWVVNVHEHMDYNSYNEFMKWNGDLTIA